MEGIELLDKEITLWINNSLGLPCLDGFWAFMSAKLVWIPLYVLIAALLVWKLGWKRGLVAVAVVALAFFFDERVNNLIKHIVERVRPCNDEWMLTAGLRVLETGGGWSFPSGHACNVFGLAMSSAVCLNAAKQRRCHWHYVTFIFIWAALVGLSRIMVGRHFFGDVLTGAVEGCVIGLVCGLGFLLLCRKVKWLAS